MQRERDRVDRVANCELGCSADPWATNPYFNAPAVRCPSALTANAADRQAMLENGC